MNDQNPKISIGLPVFNGAKYLEETLRSILKQTFQDFELIICDNASEDGTQEICLKYLLQDARVKYHRNDINIGAAGNYNKTFKLAKGEYFKWAAHDDYYHPSFLEKCLNEIKRDCNMVLCFTDRIVVDENGEKQELISDALALEDDSPARRYSAFLKKFRKNTIHCDPVFGLIRADALKKTGLIGNYDTSDMVLLSELALIGKFHQLNEYLFFRRRHPEMSTKANPSLRQRALWFDPQNKFKIQMPKWKWLFEFAASVKMSGLNFNEKICCYVEIIKWGLFRYRGLAADLIRALPQMLLIIREKRNMKNEYKLNMSGTK